MNTRAFVLGGGVAATLFVAAAAPGAALSAGRHLVYGFTWGTQSDLQVHTSGVDSAPGANAGSGTNDYVGGLGDQGTITVDVLSEQPDKGLVIKVSEQAQKTRSAAAATCVAYATTGVICDPNATVNPEEMSLIRFLGPGFVNPDSLDAKRHWSVQTSTPQYSLKADYTIAKDADGLMTIDENREIAQQQPTVETTDVTATIGYDFNRALPTSVDEYSIARSQSGTGEYQTVKTQTELHLESDSSAGVKG